jgi:transcription elongation factor Elf1
VSCRVCGAEHSSKVNVLEEAVDVYANWIDANARLNSAEEAAAADRPATSSTAR